MTIVLQHQFWDLGITEHAFEVGLSFSGVPERLVVPFEALTGFFDPSVQFGLKFEVKGEETEDAPEPPPLRRSRLAAAPAPSRSSCSRRSRRRPRKPPRRAGRERPRPARSRRRRVAATLPADDAAPAAEVVSLDAFRKKN